MFIRTPHSILHSDNENNFKSILNNLGASRNKLLVLSSSHLNISTVGENILTNTLKETFTKNIFLVYTVYLN